MIRTFKSRIPWNQILAATGIRYIRWGSPGGGLGCPGGTGKVLKDGYEFDIAATVIFTVFGYGFVKYDRPNAMGSDIYGHFNPMIEVIPHYRMEKPQCRPLRGIMFGWFKFVVTNPW